MSSVPFWLIALVLACVAPYGAALVQAFLDSRLRRRTLDVLSRASALDGLAEERFRQPPARDTGATEPRSK